MTLAFFDSGAFMPHGHCYLWNPWLVWLHILSDLFTAIAYYSIPISLVYVAISGLPLTVLEDLSEALLDFSDLADLQGWLMAK